MSGHTKGQEVTNGYWFGQVLAVFNEWVWVQPLRGIDGSALLINDGPLTFRASDLSRAAIARADGGE